MFCVECGREGKVFEALCPSCFLERKKLIELPKTFDIVQCSTCDSLLLDKKWQKAELEPAIDRSISSSLWHNPILKVQELRQEKQFEDRSNITDKITVVLDLDGTEKEIHHSIRVRLKSGTCPSCSKRLGGYYEAIIQVRPTSKSFTGDLLTEVRDHVHARVEEMSRSKGKVFISKEEDMHEGVDFYLSSNRAGKSISKELAKKFRGTVRSSPKLHGRVDGKEVYRVTYIVRLAQE